MKNNHIPIVLSAGSDFVVPTYMTIYSMLKNASPSRCYKIYILTPGNYPNDVIKWIKELEIKYPYTEIEIVDMGDKYHDIDIKLSHVRYPAYYRLSIPKLLLQDEKCIYIDSDVIVEGDISEYYDIDIEGYCLAGVKDIGFTEKEKRDKMTLLGIETMEYYINSGTLLMNLKEIRNLHIEDALEAGAYKYYPCVDQDVFNSICFGKIKVISLRFNAMTRYTFYGNREQKKEYGYYYEEALKNPVIIHYIGGKVKPWVSRYVLGGNIWWKYVNELDDEIKERYVTPFIKESNPSNKLKVAVISSSFLKKIGLYDVIMKILKDTGLFRKIKKKL